MKDESKQADYTCLNCGKVFKFWKSHPRRYCSRKCSVSVTAKANLGIVEARYEMTCEICGASFSLNATQKNRVEHHFCSQKCFGVHVSQTRKGIPRPDLRGEKPHMQKRVDKQCEQCGKAYWVKFSHKERNRFCSKSCHVEWQRASSATISGENNFNWRGGYEPYYGPNWHKQRRLARERDNFTCQRCGVTENESKKSLVAHHVKPFREFGRGRHKEANDLSNLICYCVSCHGIVEHESL